MASGTRLQAIDEIEEPRSAAQKSLVNLLLTNLRVLSQRTVIALASLFDLALIASAFALWLLIIQNPSTPQLVGVAGYAVFVLLALYMRRR